MREFEFVSDYVYLDEVSTIDLIDPKVYQEMAERGIHKDRFSHYELKVVVTVYYDIERR